MGARPESVSDQEIGKATNALLRRGGVPAAEVDPPSRIKRGVHVRDPYGT